MAFAEEKRRSLDILAKDDDWADPVNRAVARVVKALREKGVDDGIIYYTVEEAYAIGHV